MKLAQVSLGVLNRRSGYLELLLHVYFEIGNPRLYVLMSFGIVFYILRYNINLILVVNILTDLLGGVHNLVFILSFGLSVLSAI